MFKKILIANRGEIALRIMLTCREMGIATVAIYSEVDQHAPHVRAADEAYCIGPAPAAQSYLRSETIIDVARRSGAEAIHPGYGFLSENPTFVEACTQAKIVFIGPPAAAMRLMGSKIAAKQLAQSVGAPTIPGYSGDSQEVEALGKEARQIGFPLLIKASAGGGGKGMREVHDAKDFQAELEGARREALAAFGDGTVFLERLLLRPRHIEIQVLGDNFGNLVHLGERECSIQRRHQKIVEESPSPVLSAELRAEMGEVAVRIARAAGYVNAGTLEFMLDEEGRFYFLEMNTRLQVEHPVTEYVTGLDLVRHQLRIAAGEPLGLSQQSLWPRGHAIEMRLYAEDPERDFLPSTGTITRFSVPRGPGIRIDSGIGDGTEITQYYDPMIAKLIASAEERPAAIARMRTLLEQVAVFGVQTNVALLYAITRNPAFQEGQTTTSFLEAQNLLDPTQNVPTRASITVALQAAALFDIQTAEQESLQARAGVSPWRLLGPWSSTGEARRLTYSYQGVQYQVLLRPTYPSLTDWEVQIDEEEPQQLSCGETRGGRLLWQNADQQFRAEVYHDEAETLVASQGRSYRFERASPPDVDASAHGGSLVSTQKALMAPMAGTIVKINVSAGAEVQQRQVLAILSAMKMEHTISAPYDGTVQQVHYSEGDVVKGGAVVIEMA